MDFFSIMAEEKIKQAIKDGQLDNLPGKGKPLKLENLDHVPEELRASYHMMKNTGYLPEEVKVNKELVTLRKLLKAAKNDSEKADINKRITEKEIQYELMLKKRKLSGSSVFKKYSTKISNKLFGI
ncbi:DnaJ family domain-containing protein [Aquibacillus salsiterrae]|uniref:DUF1992 domain-containing protein n=1 Tax=Aquibacillus salsiterrae TaxID=2950439 RepID=A0A9X3WEB8_9BACI|nr:DnaJ family domain-containing protein [Aquibacillus salsiterrae]MDC3418167.1 DUF1992 domain-containing protein [Aquibacillus salsiterrae]